MRATIAATCAHALAAWLVLWWPFAGRRRYRRLSQLRDKIARSQKQSAPRWSWNPIPRRRARRARKWESSIKRKWTAVLWLVPIVALGDVDLGSVGLRAPDEWGSMVSLLAGVGAGAALIVLRLRFARQRARLRRIMQPFVHLVPRPGERRRFVWLAVTAGVTEELLYRSFGLSYVHWIWPGLSAEGAVVLTSAAFGFAHLYQGWKNVVLTGLLGAVFAIITIDTGSVLPAIIVHTLVDLRILLLTPLVDDAEQEP